MTRPRRRRRSLRAQLVANALVGVALPVAFTGGLALFLFTYHLDIIEAGFERSRTALTHEIARTDLMARADDTARQIDAFFVNRIAEAKTWAAAGAVVDAARAADTRHEGEGLTELPILEVEQRFQERKSLGLWTKAQSYLRQQVAASPYFAEIFFTDRNGFNVAMTNPTSDFVQSDEGWWQSAWTHGASVGEVEYDDSAGVWSVDISIRIDRPDGKEPVGVMKTVLAIEPVQEIADRVSQNLHGGRVTVATERGALIAETASGHDQQRIMSDAVNLKEQGDPALSAGFGGERSGFTVDRGWLTGYTRTGGRETYASAAGRFAGFDWIVFVRKPVAAIQGPIAALRGIDGALRGWRVLLALALGAMVVLCASLAIALSASAARRYASALGAVSEMAERLARGDPANAPFIEEPEEIARVNDAVRDLGALCSRIPRPGQAG